VRGAGIQDHNRGADVRKDPLCRVPVLDIGRHWFDIQPLAHRRKVARLARNHPDPRALIDERLHNAEPQSAAAAGDDNALVFYAHSLRSVAIQMPRRMTPQKGATAANGVDAKTPSEIMLMVVP
jgi:hypothetical protein